MESRKSHKGIWTFIIILVVLLLAGGGWYWYDRTHRNNDSDLSNYVPSKEFKPAFEALNTQPEPQYDIEETVRLLNGLEVAQQQSDDFMSFLEYMAKQDYSRVPAEVLDAKKRLLPILQKMFDLQKQYDEIDNIWLLARSATSGASNFAENASPIGVLSAIFTGNPLDAVNVNRNLAEAKTAAFEQYEKDMKLKESLKEEINGLRLEYIDYLADYAPIYFKYMKEWDRLCLDRDKAYLDLYANRSKDAVNAVSKVLENYPTNREALLLKAMALVQLSGEQGSDGILRQGGIEGDSIPVHSDDRYLTEAYELLETYTDLYPDRSAPALVLKAMLNLREGNESGAMSCLDQASVEYPRQAAALTDLLDSYKNRSYLNRSSEGKYLLRLYRSTMEGYGMFSPNLLKAKCYAAQGRTEDAKTEIFNHFYRRGNQGVYDCLLSDMQYCEENMYSLFRQLLMEQSYLDVSVAPTTDWLVSKNDREVSVTINNRSDVDLENVRIFLCLHYTDMYKDEYDVVKCPSINIIPHHDKTEIGTVPLEYEDKTYNDISHIRAIAMTDDRICWIDNVDYKYVRAYEANRQSEQARQQTRNRRESLLRDFKVDSSTLLNALKSGIKIYSNIRSGNKTVWDSVSDIWAGDDKKLSLELPRVLSLIDPVFSLHQLKDKEKALLPRENYLTENAIRLKFDYEPNNGDTIPLYVYSDYVSFRITIHFAEGKAQIQKVEVL